MIEMSVDKETVLPGDGGVDHLRPQQPTECTDSCHTTADASVASVCSMAVISSSMVVTEEMANSADTVGGTVELGSSTGGNPFQPRNGLKQPPQQQALPRPQPHPPKLSKRRNTMNAGFKHPGSGKRRRRANSESDPVLPTNFLLGGNIFDPLNLNSLMDEEVNRALNAETPKSSPLPARSRDPVEILIPRDITDPLNLNCGSGLDGGILVSPVKSGGRKRHRNRHHGGVGGATGTQLEPSEPDKVKAEDVGSTVPEGKALEGPGEGTAPLDPVATVDSPRPYELNTSVNCRDTAVLHPVLSHGLADPGSLTSSVALPQQLSSRQRKRRRASSRCDPAVAAPRKGDGETGREPGKPPASFLTLVGSGGTLQPQGRRRRQQQKKFQYGNYNKYYGYRNPGRSEDPRARVLRPEWFRGKEVLDLGCNTGHLTLSIARNWLPARIVGLDIDGALVHAARQNVRHYLSEVQAQESRQASKTGTESDGQKLDGPMEAENKAEEEEEEEDKRHRGEEDNPVSIERTGRESMEESGGGHPFPVSLRISRGPIAAPPLPDSPPAPPGIFPANISFIRGNYVLESDTLLQTQQPEYDVILCLSVTKWVHLNWGDVGVQRLFRRVYKHLRPGGLFILEPQPWASYSKRKKLTDTIYKNYQNIRFRPDQFSSYLTSEVGFSSYELIGTPKTCARGFQRPIYLFHKGPSSHRK